MSYEHVMEQIDHLVHQGQHMRHIESLIESARHLIDEERAALWLYAQARLDYRTIVERRLTLPEST